MECLEGWMVGWLDEVEGAGRGAAVEVVMEKGNQWIWKNGTKGESPWSGKEKYSHEKQHL